MNKDQQNKKKNETRFGRFCTWLIALSPMLDSYVFSFLPNIPIQYTLYVIIFILILIKVKNKTLEFKKPQNGVMLTTVLLLIISIIDISAFGIGVNFTADFGKFVMWGVSLFLFSGFIDGEYLKSVIYKVAIVNAVIALIQSAFFYIAGIRLPNVFDLGFLTYRVNDMSQFEDAYRPAALFSEPAAYSVYALMALTLSLFESKNNNKRKWLITTLLILSLIFSASTTGLVLLIVIILFGLLRLLKRFCTSPIKTLVVVIPIVTLMCMVATNIDIIIENTGSFGKVISQSIYKVNNTESVARMGGSFDRIDLSDDNILLGYGIGNEYFLFDNTLFYMNSLARSVLQFGLLGTISIFILLVSNLFKSKRPRGKLLSTIFIILLFTSNTLFSTTSMVLLLSVYLLDIKSNRITKTSNFRIGQNNEDNIRTEQYE